MTMINSRLFEHYGIDTSKDLKMRVRCPRPFDTVLIDKQGSCYACECQAWLPQSIGNLQLRPLADILGGDTHRHLQGTIEDGTFRYCNEHRCTHLRHGMGWDEGRPFQVRLAIDDSCNLRCPSCRNGMIFHKEGSAYRRGIKLADRVNDWLATCDTPVQVHIGSDGDPFASHVYRHFMEHTPVRDNITYTMLTNGLMFQEFHTRVPHVMRGMTQLGVSIDGATQATYERLRLGGRWDKINENLESMRQQKREHGFEFVMHFVVQRHNYHEMRDIIYLAERYEVDRLWLNKIEDWNVMSDWSEQDIFNPEHPEHERFQEQLERVKPLLDHEHTRPKVQAPRLYRRR